MSNKKKKHKQKKSISLLNEMDRSISKTYDSLIDEIEDLQIQLNIADQKAMKKAKKKMKKDPNYFKTSKERFEARKKVLAEMEQSSFLDKAENLLKDLAPIIVVIARLIATLIVSILSLDCVKTHINENTLSKMNRVYKIAMSIK